MVWSDFDFKHLAKTNNFGAALTIATWEFVGGMLLWDFHYRDVDKLWLEKALFLYDYLKYGTWLILAVDCMTCFPFPAKHKIQ